MTTQRKPLPRSATQRLHQYGSLLPEPPTPLPNTPALQPGQLTERGSDGHSYSQTDAYDDALNSYFSDSAEEDLPPPYRGAAVGSHVGLRNQEDQLSNSASARPDDVAQELLGAEGPGSIVTTLSQADGETLHAVDLSTSSKARLKVITALEDTSIFLGGLIKHPTESTRHFTVLRHSHGLVYYKGPNTSLAISIFSDQPVPEDRRLWLQMKGWTGNTGMTAKAFFRSNSNWVNITPDQQVTAAQLPPLDERAWQRDIQKFVRKANRSQQKHLLRETVVIRIPYEASDGYFRIIVTSSESRRVLCPSPVFRVASTSLSASSLRGASLKTLPVELGVKVAQVAATTVATNAIGPVVGAVKDQILSAAPVVQYSGHAQTVWDASGAQDQIDAVNERYDQRLEETAENRNLETSFSAPAMMQSYVVGDESGPTEPYPLRVTASIDKGSGESTSRFQMPSANLNNIPPDSLSPLPLGVYFGWAFVVPKDKSQQAIHDDWHHAVISVMYDNMQSIKIARRKVIRVYLVHEYPSNMSFIGLKLKLVIMGYLRPLLPPSDSEAFLLEALNDIAITKASLSRSAWGHAETLRRVKTAQSERSMTDKMVDLRIAGQRQIDRVPVHLLGVRSDSFGAQDRGMHGNGGLWIKRD